MDINKLQKIVSAIAEFDKEIIGLEKIANQVANQQTKDHTVTLGYTKIKPPKKEDILDEDGSLKGEKPERFNPFEIMIPGGYMGRWSDKEDKEKKEPEIEVSDVQMLQIIGVLLREKYEARKALMKGLENWKSKQ